MKLEIDIEKLKDQIIDNWYDGMELRDLFAFYYDIQKQHLDEMDDEDVLDIAKGMFLIDEDEDEK